LDRYEQQHVIPATVPGPLIWCCQERLGFRPIKERNQGLRMSFPRNGQDALNLRGMSRFLVRCVMEERTNGSQTKVTAASSDFALDLQVVQKR
jgi:hypothetical protein